MTAKQSCDPVVTEVETVQVWEVKFSNGSNAAVFQAEMYQHSVVDEIFRLHSRLLGVQVAKVRVTVRRKCTRTNKGVSETGAVSWTSNVAQELVVVLRTLEHAIAQVLPMDADRGVATAVETRTCIAVTPLLVFVSRTIVDTVTTHVHR